MTYNIWNYNTNWKARLEKISKQVEEFQPDVVAFQEVRYRFYDNLYRRAPFQVEDIAEKLGPKYQYFYRNAMTYLSREFFHEDEGHAIFSRYPIRETDYIRLTRDLDDREDDHQRLVARALVFSPVGFVNVLSSHLSLSENSRKRTVIELWNYLKLNYKNEEGEIIPQIFVGDMNGLFLIFIFII